MLQDLWNKIKSIGIGVIIMVLTALGITAVGLTAIFNTSQNPDIVPQEVTASYTNADGQTFELALEVADEPAEWSAGLMHREQVPLGTGMLFVFPDSQLRSFWMKNTFVSLDIIFLDENARVINFHEFTTPNQIAITYTSQGEARFAIETAAGWAAFVGLQENDVIKLN